MKSIMREVFDRFERGYDPWSISKAIGISHSCVIKILKGELKNDYEVYIYMHPSEAWN